MRSVLVRQKQANTYCFFFKIIDMIGFQILEIVAKFCFKCTNFGFFGFETNEIVGVFAFKRNKPLER